MISNISKRVLNIHRVTSFEQFDRKNKRYLHLFTYRLKDMIYIESPRCRALLTEIFKTNLLSLKFRLESNWMKDRRFG